MSGPDQHTSVRAVLMSPLATDQRSIEIKEYKRGYFSVVVAMILAKARRDTDATDDITAAVENCHISDQAAGPSNQYNPFKF